MKKGVLFIVCGPSGVGKTSLCDFLLEKRRRLRLSVSYTTRKPRGGESDGFDYHFVDKETFLTMRDEGQFVEWAEVHGNFYGTSERVILDAWEGGHDVLFDIDYQGARQIKERFPHACTVLVVPPDMKTLERRLRNRATDAPDVIERRLAAARHELAQYAMFDYIVENDRFEDAASALAAIYDASRHAEALQVERMKKMLNG